MKIFISHASANKPYGDALVELLRGVGVGENEIIFTSNIAYGIPNGKNIFDWLKSQIEEKPYVIYLLSEEYYSSVACLNEMGAAWVTENEHVALFTPKFSLNNEKFQNGALDSKEIIVSVSDKERILQFIEQLKKFFNITSNQVIIHQKLDKYLSEIKLLTEQDAPKENITTPTKISDNGTHSEKNIYDKLLEDIRSNKFNDEELLLLAYIRETGKNEFATAWEKYEIETIKQWENENDLSNSLSTKYQNAIRRFEMRGYVETFIDFGETSVKLKKEIGSNILDLPQDVEEIINEVLKRNDTSLPF